MEPGIQGVGPAASGAQDRFGRVPPQAFFGVSAVFHYLGPSLAVLLFARLDVLGVAWLRVASAAVVFALWRRPWRSCRPLGRDSRRTLLALGAVLAVMNTAFYLAVDRLPGQRRWRRRVEFPPGTPMSPAEERSVEFSVPMTKDQLVGLLGTYSGIITLEAGPRAEFSRRVRAFLDRQPWDRVDLPLICRCLRSTRLPG